MKQISIIIGAIFFSTFFYKQNIGLNLSLFSLLTIIVLLINNRKAFENTNTILKTTAYLLTAIAVFMYQSDLTIIANIVAYFTVIGSVSESKSSIFTKWLNGMYTTIVAFFHLQFEIDENKGEIKSKRNIDYLHWLKIIGIPLVVLIIFISLYKNGNPMFSDIISKINFSFLNIQWLLFTVLGYYLFYNISSPIRLSPATEIDLKTGNFLTQKEASPKENLKNEKQLGIILMGLLNVLIIFYLITDISYLVSNEGQNAVELSQQVHNGVNALIASIILAIVIILYFFRGNLNFYKDNKSLKTLTYVWILLNIILVFTIAIKNYQYIHSFGFTYKRIGVLIYLILTFIGLLSTLIKVLKIKNFWYLIRVNTQTAFAILIITCAINWDKSITEYNINYAKEIDMSYLINLSNNNTFLLKEYSDANNLNIEYSHDIDTKYFNYLDELKTNSWQEMNYDNLKN